jgi:monoamine oxidase
MERYRWMPEHPWDGAGALDFFRFPGDALEERVARAAEGERRRVCIVGAGIAGLVAAYELLRGGYSVVVVDRADRVGGRIRTWREEGVSGEFGPMRIPRAHEGTMHYVKEFRLGERDFIQNNDAGWLLLRDKKVRITDWADLLANYGGDPRHLFGGLGLYKTELDPEGIWQQALNQALAWLSPAERWSVMNGDLGPSARVLGSIALWQLVQGMLHEPARWVGAVTPRAPGTGPSTLPPTRRFSNAGWEFVGHATGALWEERVSALEACIEDIWVHGARRIRLAEGMEALPEALEGAIKRLGGSIVPDTRVTRVVSEPMKDEVRVFAGEEEIRLGVESFQYVICAVPASGTSAIEFQPTLGDSKREALTSLTYFSAAKSLVLVDRRRWELEDGIFGGASFTDLPIQQCWYPADNALPDPHALPVATRTGDPDGWDTAPRKFVAADATRSNSPAILTAAYMTGVNAERFTSLDVDERHQLVRRCLERLHPGIGSDIKKIRHWCWIEQRTPGGGAWTYFAPGGHERHQRALCEPHPGHAPRVFFAGEHICVLHGWMQSAIQSSLEATMALFDAP